MPIANTNTPIRISASPAYANPLQNQPKRHHCNVLLRDCQPYFSNEVIPKNSNGDIMWYATSNGRTWTYINVMNYYTYYQ